MTQAAAGTPTLKFRMRRVIGRTICRVRGHRPVLMLQGRVVATGPAEVIGSIDTGTGATPLWGAPTQTVEDTVAGCRRCWSRVGD